MRYIVLSFLFLMFSPKALATAREAEIAMDRLAHRLELVRNQIELTIANHSSVRQDVLKQERELSGMLVFARIPLASTDAKSAFKLAEGLRSEFRRAAQMHTGFRLRSLKLAGPWKSAPKRIPESVAFDSDYRIPEEQVADSRDVSLEIVFDKSAPKNPSAWLAEQQRVIGRLLTPVRWSRSGRTLKGLVRIHRFREFKYPQLTAPDLSRYQAPRQPASASVEASNARIEKYRREIRELWPRAQPHLDQIRAFAKNDLRMNFFLKRANVQGL